MNIISNTNNNVSLMEQEKLVIETIITCNSTMRKVNEKYKLMTRLFETENLDNYLKLYESITGVQYRGNTNPNVLKPENFRNNHFAYFVSVNNFIVKSEETLIRSLNENINDSFDITNFQNEIKNTISELLKINDFNKYDKLSPEIQRISFWARKPIYIYGYDIINNIMLQKELAINFNLPTKEIISILFDKSNKQILFVYKGKVLVYDIKTNNLGYYNNIGADILLDEHDEDSYLFIEDVEKIDEKNYLNIIRESINNNMVEIYKNVDVLNLKFSDNLYRDNARAEFLTKNKHYTDTSLIVKQPLSSGK